MVRLVDDLLDVSRVTRGNIELRKERVELAAVVASAAETSRPLIDRGVGPRTHGHTIARANPSGRRLDQAIKPVDFAALQQMLAGSRSITSAARTSCKRQIPLGSHFVLANFIGR
jgi:signal transduction histidine kinase